MPKVKPYIITIKYVGFYEDPRPTQDQIANEVNVDALEIIIEDAVVTPAAKVSVKPVEVVDVDSRTINVHPVTPVTIHTVPVVDTKGLEKGGTSEKILKALAQSGPRTLSQIRQLTRLNGASVQVTVSRLKKQGRICVTGNDAGKSIYKFVK